MAQRDEAVQRWASSGCMYLTGPPESPGLGPPAPLVPALDRLADRLRMASSSVGATVMIDPLAMLAARAAISRFHRQGQTSCGGATRLLPTTDGWIALSVARPDDIDAIPALVQGAVDDDDPWRAVARWCSTMTSADVVERAVLLGLPVAELPPCPSAVAADSDLLVDCELIDNRSQPATVASELLVVDLSSLWAGPLCGAILHEAGCRVVKVESTGRPDGARLGPSDFFGLLNHGKTSVALDLGRRDGIAMLRRLLARADVVIEASRPRAMRQWGISPRTMLATGPRVWVSITAHGYHGADENRVGFGDDAAVAGGLVVHDDSGPSFCADAVADPITGLTAAVAALEALVAGHRVHIDAAMSRIAARAAGPTLEVASQVIASPPESPMVGKAGPVLGADTARVLAELDVG